MSEIVKIQAREALPAREPVLAYQGIRPGEAPPEPVVELCNRALALLAACAEPAAITASISREEFAAVYEGEGWNEPSTPVGDIFPQASRLALFAATVGARVSEEIGRRFQEGDLALGAMLDSAASAAADQLGELLQQRTLEQLGRDGAATAETRVLRYSPGYCGWHVTGQRRLFDFLQPQHIGLALNESSLMWPIKSISGVLIAGPPAIHVFANAYPFCRECEHQTCRARIDSLDVQAPFAAGSKGSDEE